MLVALVLLLSASSATANNLQITNVSLVNKSTWSLDVQFDISWENSWLDTDAPSTTANWDAAWVFVKVSTRQANEAWTVPWTHASLADSGHTAPTGSQFDMGTTGSKNMGVFMRRTNTGSGTNDWNSAVLRWDFGADGVSSTTFVRAQVFGIEMVYVSSGSFYLGSGGGEGATLYKYPTSTHTYQVTSEGSLEMGQTTDYLYGGSVLTATLPAAFPKGFDPFYIMKMEISQRQYADFLNTLSRTQQQNRTRADVSGDTITNTFVMSNTSSLNNQRVAIRAPGTGNGTTEPITFGMDYDEDGIFNEAGDGGWLAANMLFYIDLAAYADWAGLRPLTEFEFTKAARGGEVPVPNELAWGNTYYVPANDIENVGFENEVSTNPESNINYETFSQKNFDGPMRVGSFATSDSTRTSAGAGLSGALDLSGNMWEWYINICHSDGINFDGQTGDGVLSSTGVANVTNWPTATGTGNGKRGGGSGSNDLFSFISDRQVITNNSNSGVGGRVGRQAP